MLGWRAMALLVFSRGTAVQCRAVPLRTDTNVSSHRDAPVVATCGTGRNACATQTIITYREYVTHRTAPRDLAHEIIARSLARDDADGLCTAGLRPAHLPLNLSSLYAHNQNSKTPAGGQRYENLANSPVRLAHTQRLCHPERSKECQTRAILRVAIRVRIAIAFALQWHRPRRQAGT